ncbi:MAG TPA: fused MFS/spermidine synthase [Xanthobacteraceae bacterium]|nr:fused MFS/spermidine synthase [Xanthobacteraceae bacterium]
MSFAMLSSCCLRKAVKFAVVVAFGVLALAAGRARADGLVDESVRARMLQHRDGRVAHIESEYHDVFVEKRGPLLALTTRARNETYFHSIVDLRDPDALPVPYTRIMNAALLYPQSIRHVLMIGLGAGSVSTYLGRAMPELRIDAVELDPGVVAAGRKYFGLKETDKVRFIESDGRVYLNRSKDLYDLIILDAFRDLGVPFHLLTREFYDLVKAHLAPGGAVVSNVAANTKLYVSTIVTLRAVFSTVDVYADWKEAEEVQSIAVATTEPRPSADELERRAQALQAQYHFRYPPGDFVAGRVTDENADGGQVLTDDFAPVNLYETMPLGKKKR